ncbi:MAG: HPr family phosphocarrier protein [Polyangiaceae bacterium]|nr:HPr family phosphocarrier protein [Polyangiaceae bacterium]
MCSDSRRVGARRPRSSLSHAKGTFEVKNRLGLHARAATKLVQLACRFPCEVTLGRDGQVANAKSVMGVLLLCGAQGTALDVEARGDGADDAVRSIGELIDGLFGEGE